ncbi:hypothetical protein KY348_00065 [Candidatus Woesearchaeota archaeon]|nr:hypothetical protein [Candidatus Woesearchaeota archaeon]
MIGRPEWFERRKYGGWGVHPRTWQGVVYIILVLVPFVIFQALQIWDAQTRIYVTIGWVLFLLLDVGHIMIALKRDEREEKIEALSERNAAWSMMIILVIGLAYQIITSALNQSLMIDWFLAAALFAGLIVKSVSNFTLERKTL